MDRIILAVLGLALVYFAFDKFVLGARRAAVIAAEDRSYVVPAAGPVANDMSIAVLPFVDMSQARDQEYFSDGLSEELLNQLAQIPQLRVIARTSSFAFKGKGAGVRKSGDTLRITAQLIRTSDSSHLWSQTYDRNLTDVFKVQDEISREVVAALKLKLLPGKEPDNTQRTRNPAAYEQYLIGLDVGRPGGRPAVEAAMAAFERAIALDPGYAHAWADLSFSYASMADFAEDPAAREAQIARFAALVQRMGFPG